MSALALIKSKGGGAQLVRQKMAVVRRDAVGAEVRDWADDGPWLDCWRQNVSSRLAYDYEARQLKATHSIYLAEDPGIAEGDRVRMVKDSAQSFYLVHGAVDAAGLGQLWRLDVEEVR